MSYDPANPLIVQGDRSILVEVDNPRYVPARNLLAAFAELEKSPEHIHTYRLTPLSLWNAAAAGMTADEMLDGLARYSKFPLPPSLGPYIREMVSRYGRVRLERDGEQLRLVCSDQPLLEELSRHKKIRQYLGERLDSHSYRVDPAFRGVLKQALIAVEYPAEDLAGYTEGASLPMALREIAVSGLRFVVRDYQREAAEIFHAGGGVRGGSGVIVLPCGAGKTIVGLAVMALLQRSTLVLTTSITAVKQWRRELLDKTTLTEDQIAEYTGESKDIGPVTLATYQILTYRRTASRGKGEGAEGIDASTNGSGQAEAIAEASDKDGEERDEFPHFRLFNERDWGLIIYDEVHLLPAPVFRITAQIQARRRLGLTATLVREDHREADVFSLIGPKRYDVPWRELETQGWIAEAQCTEIRLSLPPDKRMEYAVADWRAKFRIASENPGKLEVVDHLLKRYQSDRVLIIGQYLRQLREVQRRFQLPLITGSTSTAEREKLYADFRAGRVRHLILSKVGNFAIDLPDANVLIQLSGTFGSRQEEAQRLGRILRPKSSGESAHFYTLVTRDTRELDFAHHRQLFLTEQGYSYAIVDAADLLCNFRPAREE
ncbi:MAG: helicase-associated domain-containing protein [Gemmatales bacterium]|nr:helicase-associated domain-containing protein [Gemmatales bacterium]MDW8385800.1 helicase-associated domain-containing protein [Gemmatales bacterium]